MNVTEIWRHPIKSHGREQLDTVQLTQGQTMPFDRTWAVTHEAAKVDWEAPEWARCANFSRGSKAPSLMAINAKLGSDGRVTLTHPDRPSITFNPDEPEDADSFIDWVLPLCPTDRALPKKLFKVPGRGMTDSDFPSVSINSVSSLKDLSQKAGTEVSQLRFRGNIWIDGIEPWNELDWVGKEVQVGTARLKVIERIERCMATTANPETGQRDLPTLELLEKNWGHIDFGIRAEVVQSGEVRVGDTATL